VSEIENLLKNYGKFISVPWAEVAPPQRVIFCVYNETEERRLRVKLEEFQRETEASSHQWAVYDLTDSFPRWMASQPYAKSYFQKPDFLETLLPSLLEHIKEEFVAALNGSGADKNFVVAVIGSGALFGFLKIRAVVEQLAPLTQGRLLVFFPGEREGDNYRLLGAYDGWNYLATLITAEDEF
jgi:hypothetical protein